MRMFVRRPTRGCCRIRLLWPLSVSRKKHVSKLAVRTQGAHNIKKGRVMEGAARLSKAPPKRLRGNPQLPPNATRRRALAGVSPPRRGHGPRSMTEAEPARGRFRLVSCTRISEMASAAEVSSSMAEVQRSVAWKNRIQRTPSLRQRFAVPAECMRNWSSRMSARAPAV